MCMLVSGSTAVSFVNMAAESLMHFTSFLHTSSSHFSSFLSATWSILPPVLITCNIVILMLHYFAVGIRNPLYITGCKGRLYNVLKLLKTRVGPYHPTIWTFGGHLQTLFGDLLRGSPTVKYASEDIEFPDGGILRLDWASDIINKSISESTAKSNDPMVNGKDVNGKCEEGSDKKLGNNGDFEEQLRDSEHPRKDNKEVTKDDNEQTSDKECQMQDGNKKESCFESQNIVLILPGLTGDSSSSYALQFSEDAIALGYHAVVLNHRGTSIPPQTYRYACAANSEDLEYVIKHIHEQYPNSRICAVGVSLGGIILMNYLSRVSDSDSRLHAAMVISVPYDSFVASASIERPITRFSFNRFLTRRLQQMYMKNKNALETRGVDVPVGHITAMAKANTIREFDAAIVAPMFNYKDIDDYYYAASVVEKQFENIKTPLLCLSADDDPFSPHEQIPIERIKNCDNVALLLTHTGGHVGFLEGLLPIGRGYMNKVYKEFIRAAFEEL